MVPGTGGGECAFRECIEKGATLFGLQRVPSVARLIKYGKTVCATGYRKELHVAALPQFKTDEVRKIISSIFDMPCIALPHYLNLTLTPSNPILHTVRLRTLFKDYQEGVTYGSIPLFYEEWNNEASELLFKCDDEVQQICAVLNPYHYDLSYVKSLKTHYDSDTPEQLTKKISSIPSLQGLKTPMMEADAGYIPDFHSRYFTADFPFGLDILVQIADFMKVDVPNMKDTLKWYRNIAQDDTKFCFEDFGIFNKTDFIRYYEK